MLQLSNESIYTTTDMVEVAEKYLCKAAILQVHMDSADKADQHFRWCLMFYPEPWEIALRLSDKLRSDGYTDEADCIVEWALSHV